MDHRVSDSAAGQELGVACPCCGRPLDGDPVVAAYATGSNVMVRVARALRDGPLAMKPLAAAVYGDDPDGGPEWAAGSIRTTIARSADAFAARGWRIACVGRGRGARRYLQRAI